MERQEDWLTESEHIRELVLNRLHYTYAVKDFFTFREDYRYVYSNVGRLLRLPLLWRAREIQANMVTLDGENRNLVYLPSRELKSITEGLLKELWDDLLLVLPEEVHAELSASFETLSQLAGFETPTESVEAAAKALRDLRTRFGPTKALDDLIGFAELLVTHYVPFVQLSRREESEFVFLSHGVDVFLPFPQPSEKPIRTTWRKEHNLLELLTFLMIGRIHFDVPLPLIAFQSPPWARTESVHVKINLPAGLEIHGRPEGVPTNLFEETNVIRFATHDEDNLYTYVGEVDSRRIVDGRQAILDDYSGAVTRLRGLLKRFGKSDEVGLMRSIWTLAGEFLALQKKKSRAVQAHRPRIRVRSSLALGMKAILLLLWIVVGIEYTCGFVRLLDLNSFVQLFSALLVVVLTVAVYSIEKPYARIPISAHVLSAAVAFFEFPLLSVAKILLGG